MDNWAIVKGAKNLDAAYDFINFILDPGELGQGPRVPRLQHRLKGIEPCSPSDLPFKDMVFFTPEQVATMRPAR